jgi:hypothetical protein
MSRGARPMGTVREPVGRPPARARGTVQVDQLRTPRWPAVGALATAVLAVGLAALAAMKMAHPIGVPVTGYLLGAVVTIAFASSFRALQNSRRSNPRFRPQPGLDRAVRLALLVGVAAGLANAFFLATELAK